MFFSTPGYFAYLSDGVNCPFPRAIKRECTIICIISDPLETPDVSHSVYNRTIGRWRLRKGGSTYISLLCQRRAFLYCLTGTSWVASKRDSLWYLHRFWIWTTSTSRSAWPEGSTRPPASTTPTSTPVNIHFLLWAHFKERSSISLECRKPLWP